MSFRKDNLYENARMPYMVFPVFSFNKSQKYEWTEPNAKKWDSSIN